MWNNIKIMSGVYKFLKENGDSYKSATIAEKTGIEKTTVDKELKVLKNEGKIESPKRCFYKAI